MEHVLVVGGEQRDSNPRPSQPQFADICFCVLLDIQERGDPRRLSARLQAALGGVRVVSESPRRDAEGVSLPEYSA
jgi:hypothetical protein